MTNSYNVKKARLAAALSKFNVINTLTKESKLKLSYLCNSRTFTRGEKVYSEGQDTEDFYLVRRYKKVF